MAVGTVSLRKSAPLHLSDLPLSLSLPLPLSLLLDLVEGQDVLPLLAGRLAVPTLGALDKREMDGGEERKSEGFQKE